MRGYIGAANGQVTDGALTAISIQPPSLARLGYRAAGICLDIARGRIGAANNGRVECCWESPSLQQAVGYKSAVFFGHTCIRSGWTPL